MYEQPGACPIFSNAERNGSEKTMGNIFFSFSLSASYHSTYELLHIPYCAMGIVHNYSNNGSMYEIN